MVDDVICRLIETSAAVNELPVGFFTRPIWRGFRARAERRH
jgi:hypothetical protein